jgi:flagellar FliJ protein
MNRFKFRLQTPYDLASWREKQAKQELKEKQMVYDREEECLNEKLAGMRSLIDEERSLQGKNVSIDNMVMLKELQNLSKAVVQMQTEVVKQALTELEESRHELKEVRREKKSMEKLRERRYARYLYECLWQEQSAIDEAAVTGFWRKHNGST